MRSLLMAAALLALAALLQGARAETLSNIDQDCTLRQFKCKNNKCIQEAWTCDGEDDCDDNSDEMDCTGVGPRGKRSADDNIYIGNITPLKIAEKGPSFEDPQNKNGPSIVSPLFPKSIIDLTSMKYLPLASILAGPHGSAFKKWKRDTDDYIRLYPVRQNETETARQKPLMPSWTTMQFNKRPMINNPWMKDTHNVAMTPSNTINNAMLELSDFDMQRETAKANLLLVQKMAELVQAERDKVKTETNKAQMDMQRMVVDRERMLMETQKLEMEKDALEAKLMTGTARKIRP